MIGPFDGFLPSEKSLGRGETLCLPFDCLTKDLEKKLRRADVNAVHLEEPRPNLEYAFRLWNRWRADSALRRYAGGYYLLKEAFPGGSRAGLLGMADLAHAGRIWPHERCYRRFIEKRKRHFRKARLHLSPVFLVAPDESGDILKEIGRLMRGAGAGIRYGRSLFDGVERTLYPVESKAASVLRGLLAREPGYLIADGHHRYNAALELAREGHLRRTLVYVTSAFSGGGLLKKHPPVAGRKKQPEAPPPLPEIIARARRGELMPRKATYFWPKVPCGLVYAEV